MSKKKEIRVVALGLLKKADRIFVAEGYDNIKDEKFYRALGGGVNFGESSYDALKREFQEELQAELTNIQYLGCIESIFTCRGKSGHEIIQLYQCDFVDPKFYELRSHVYAEKDHVKMAFWMPIDQFTSGALKLVPEKFLPYCLSITN